MRVISAARRDDDANVLRAEELSAQYIWKLRRKSNTLLEELQVEQITFPSVPLVAGFDADDTSLNISAYSTPLTGRNKDENNGKKKSATASARELLRRTVVDVKRKETRVS